MVSLIKGFVVLAALVAFFYCLALAFQGNLDMETFIRDSHRLTAYAQGLVGELLK
ncbi:MAG: hypothetical protein RL538_835 [Candidatus Parcubacteria bacterium]|jgi:hypothetical protein